MTHFYHANRLGHVIAMASSGGAWSDRYVYTPYGVQEQIAGDPATNATSGNPYRYTGRKLDPESGLAPVGAFCIFNRFTGSIDLLAQTACEVPCPVL